MKKGQNIEGFVERTDFPNKGIVSCEEGVCIVKNALPGQKIRAVVNKARNGRYEGRLLEVLTPSPLETESPCPHFGSCGGCAWLSFPYEESLKIKEDQVRRLLAPVLSGQEETCLFETAKASPAIFGYRNKMEFTFGDEVKDGPLSLGMHRRGSFYDIVSVTDCQIVDEDYRKILRCSVAYFRELQEKGLDISFYHRLRHTGYLRHLVVRKAVKTGEILVALSTTTQTPKRAAQETEAMMSEQARENDIEREILDGFSKKLLELPLAGEIAGILHVKNDSAADVVQSDGTEVLYGRDYFYEELLGLRFKISLFSFFQTNSLGAELLYRMAREFITEYISSEAATEGGAAGDKIVYDLYSGTGTIAQLVAPVAKKVIGVEIVEEAVWAARKNVELNGLHNCEFIAGDVLKVLDEIIEKPDVIILDPPRDGVHPKALKKIIGYGVEHILYISCKASSLARDLETFLANGYRAQRCVPIDQFPWTTGVETVVMLSHKKPDSVINVKVEFGEGEGKVPLDNIAKRAAAYKPKERVTYKMIKEYIEAKYGFKVHTAYIAEVKREFGLPMYDAPNAVEELKQPRKHPTAEKAEAIKDALKHFEVI